MCMDISRFKLVVRGGHACTALCCSISRPSEVLLALADYSIRCVDVGMLHVSHEHTHTHTVHCMS